MSTTHTHLIYQQHSLAFEEQRGIRIWQLAQGEIWVQHMHRREAATTVCEWDEPQRISEFEAIELILDWDQLCAQLEEQRLRNCS